MIRSNVHRIPILSSVYRETGIFGPNGKNEKFTLERNSNEI